MSLTTVLLTIHIFTASLSVGLIAFRVIMACMGSNRQSIQKGLFISLGATLVSGLWLILASGRGLTSFCLQGASLIAIVIAVELGIRKAVPETGRS